MLPYSDNPTRIIDLHHNSNVNYRGRYIFRVDEWIQPAGCKNEYSNGTNQIFTFKVKWGGYPVIKINVQK